VPDKPAIVVDGDAAQDQRPIAHQAVDVISDADTKSVLHRVIL
jgi:hypothetical protein